MKATPAPYRIAERGFLASGCTMRADMVNVREPSEGTAMLVCARVTLWILANLLPALAFAADLVSGIAAYDQQEFAEARRVLQEYADVGNARAQFAIGAMLVQGQGGDKDVPAGLGWLLCSAQNGFAMARERAPRWLENKARLIGSDRARAEAVIAAHGSEAVNTKLLPSRTPAGAPAITPPLQRR